MSFVVKQLRVRCRIQRHPAPVSGHCCAGVCCRPECCRPGCCRPECCRPGCCRPEYPMPFSLCSHRGRGSAPAPARVGIRIDLRQPS